jgi:acyl carrier protein
MNNQKENKMNIKDLIKQFIQNEILYDKEKVALEDSTLLIDSGTIDSLGIMKLLAFLEETYSIKMNEDELIPENFESIKAISLLVEKKIKT